MQQIVLNAEVRDGIGKGAVGRLRRQGKIPAIAYGRKEKPLNLEVAEIDLEKITKTHAAQNAIISLKVDKEKKEILALLKDIQHHPVTDKLLHVDFYRISLKDKITLSIPVEVSGESAGVKEGGILEHISWEVEVECLPTRIPEKIEVDITPLKIGDAVHVRDLKVEEGVEILTEGAQTIISIVPPTVVKEEVAVEEEADAIAATEPERIGEKEREERDKTKGQEKAEKVKEDKKEEDEGEKKA